MEDLIKKADANAIKAMEETTDEALKAEIARLRAQVERQQTGNNPAA